MVIKGRQGGKFPPGSLVGGGGVKKVFADSLA